MPETAKKAAIDRIHNRIRAHLRAAMVANNIGLGETATLLRENKGALSRYLNDRGPSAYLIAMILEVFQFDDPMDLFRKDPAPEFFRPGTPAVKERAYAIKSRLVYDADEAPPKPPRLRGRHAPGREQ